MNMQFVLLKEESRETPFSLYKDRSSDDSAYWLYRRETDDIFGQKGILQYHFVNNTFHQVDCAIAFSTWDEANSYMQTALNGLYPVYGAPSAISENYASLYASGNWFADEDEQTRAEKAAKEYEGLDPNGRTKLCAQWKHDFVPLSESPAEYMYPLVEIVCTTTDTGESTVFIRSPNAYICVDEDTAAYYDARFYSPSQSWQTGVTP